VKKSFTIILKIVIASFLMALSVVLTRFASFYISVTGFPSQRFGFGTIPIILSSILCGPILGVFTGAGADLIGAFAFPSGPYFYGYTISSALMGLIPWIIVTLFKKREKLLIVFDVVAFIGVLIGVCAYIFTATGFTNGKTNSKYYFDFTPSVRSAIILILIVIGFICILSCYLGYRYQTNTDIGPISQKILNKYQKLRNKGLSKEDSIHLIKEHLTGGITSSIFFESSNASFFDFSYSSKIEINRILRIIKRKNDSELLNYKYEKSEYTYLNIFSVLFINGIITNIFLLPVWNMIFYGLPYGYSLFNSTINFFISLPFKLIISWALIKVISNTGIFEILNSKAKHY